MVKFRILIRGHHIFIMHLVSSTGIQINGIESVKSKGNPSSESNNYHENPFGPLSLQQTQGMYIY